MKHRILVVDDDRHIVDLVRMYLERDGYQVTAAYDGDAAIETFRQQRPDLVILDIMMPGTDGITVMQQIRRTADTPIILLTARTTEHDRLLGLDLGADDYITKPFSPKEVAARVRAVLRRLQKQQGVEEPDVIDAGDLVIDIRRHVVTVKGKEIRLTPTEFRLLAALARSPGQVFTRAQLIQRAFGQDFEGFDRNVDVHITNLRKKIEPDPADPQFVRTIFGVGYKFEAETT